MATFTAGTASVEIGPDFSNFVRDLRADLDRVDAELGVDIVPDTTGFIERLRTELERNGVKVEIEVGVDENSLRELETLIKAKLDAMDLTATVKVDADTAAAANELAALKAAYRDMTMNVDADTTAAAAQIGALNAIPVRVNVSGDRASLMSSLGGPLTINAGVLGISQIPALGAAVSSVGISVQQLTQNALLLPGIFAAAGAGIATLTIGLDGMKDAFGEGPKALAAYQGLSDEGRRLVDTAKSYGDQWDGIKNRIGAITLDGLSQPLDRVLTNQLPALERGMGSLAGQFNTGFKTILGELGNDSTTGALDKVFGNTSQAAGILNGSITPIISSLRTLGGTGSTFLPQLAQGFTNITTRLDAFLIRSEQSGDLAKWMQEGIDAGRDLFSVLGNLGSILASVLRAGKTDGEGFLGTVDNLTDRWATFLKSSDGQAEMKAFFADGRDQLDRWAPVLQSVGGGLKSAYEGAQAWSGVLMPFLRAAGDLLQGHDGIVKTVFASYLAYRTIGPIFTAIQGGIANTSARLTAMNSAMAASTGATAFSRGLGAISTILAPAALPAVIIGASALVGILATKHQEAADAARNQRNELNALRDTMSSSGDITQETINKTAKDLTEGGFITRAEGFGISGQGLVNAGLGLDPKAKQQINDRLTQIILEQKDSAEGFSANSQFLGLSDTTVAQALQGIPEAVEKYNAAASAMTEKLGAGSVTDLAELKDALNDVGESAATLGGEMNSTTSKTGQAAAEMRQQTEAAHGTFAIVGDLAKQFETLGVSVSSVPESKKIVVNAPSVAALPPELSALAQQVNELPNGKVEIILKDEVAKAGIAQIVAPAVKNVTVNMTYEEATASGEWRAPMVIPQPKALGGPITGGIAGRDSVPILAMPGEHMLDTGDVDRLGGQAGVYRFRAALAAGLVRPMKDGGAVGWSDQNEIDLQQAINAVDKAKREREELESKKGTDDADRTGADLKIQELELKVRDLEAKKAGGSGTSTEILPQAELPGKRANSDLDKEDADAAVDQANTKRNKVYSDPASTDEEKRAADRDYQRAQNSRTEAYKAKTEGDDANISLPGIAAKGAGILAEGFLSALGLENSVLSGNNVYTKSLGKVIDFYGDKAKEQEGDGYGYTPKNLPQDKETSSSDSSSSSDTGDSGKSSSNYDAGAGVEQWRGTFGSVLRALSLPASWLDLGLAQMRTESGGNPRAINNWDSNAAKGTPSKGLMQVIDPTFLANRSEMYPNDIWNPGANIAASLRYTVGRYGSPVGVWGQGHGYREGGWVFGPGGPRDDGFLAPLSNGEFVVNAAAAGLNAPALEAMNAGVPTQLPPLPELKGRRGPEVQKVHRDFSVNFHAPLQVMDPRELIREVERHQALQAQGAMAGLSHY
ncbi:MULTISPECIES: lytic transglycosylase domain-containing protein [Nocardia]|uniref:lytic transglycosylase domain-containing protein n=1 Tax=Nocardia TaxID=1817 RepID=UPI001E2B3FB1|nr:MULTISPECIES: transglycosylase SLT domain-containing protein [Nocardia]